MFIAGAIIKNTSAKQNDTLLKYKIRNQLERNCFGFQRDVSYQYPARIKLSESENLKF